MKQRECNIVEELEIVVQPNIMLEYSKDSGTDLGNLIILELHKKQDKLDSTLKTTEKTITGAINELSDVIDKIGYDDTLNTFVIGDKSKAAGENAIAAGLNCEANGSQSVAIGTETKAVGNHSFASGYQTEANKPYDHVEGYQSIAQGKASHAEGVNTRASAEGAHAEGYETIASGVASHAEGAKYESNRNTESAGQASHAEGASTFAKADGSHAEGILNIAGRFLDEISTAAQELGISGTPQELAAKLLGYGAHAEGMNNKALGSCSHAEGQATNALTNSTHAEGDTTIAFGEASHAEGYNTQAKGNQSHAEGSSTIAEGNSAHAEGVSTVASGSFSHAEGSHTEAIGRDSHTEGVYNKAIGIASHAEGVHNIAKNQAQHVSGKYATIDESGTAIFQVGAGTDENNRKDVLKISTDGSIEIQDTEGNPFILQEKLGNLQSQIDGETSTWFFGGVPSPDTVPANEWTDDTLKKRHTGDVYINTLPLEADLTALDATGMSLWFESGSLDIDSSEYFEFQRINDSECSRTRVLFELKDEEVTINFPITLSCYVIYYYVNGNVIKNISKIINANSITLLKSTTLRKYFALVIGKGINLLSHQILQATTCDHTFTNIYAGKAWRWVEKDYHANDYHWCPIADSDAVKALAASNENKKNIQENSEAIESLGEEVAALQEQIGSTEETTPAFTDVSLFATTEKGRSFDVVYVKAPAGMLKETDQVIFARYISNKTRPRLNGMTDKSIPRSVYRGWIKPAKGGKHNSSLLLPDDMLKLMYSTTIDGYDHFYLQVDPDGDDESLLCYLWNYASVDEGGYLHPRVKDKKLGIKIVRDGKTIVDYLPFTVKVDDNDCIHFGRL